MIRTTLVTFAGALSLAGAAQAAPVVIDSFNTTMLQAVGAPSDPNGVNPNSDTLATTDAIGGVRTIVNERTSTNPSITGQQVQTVVVGGTAAVSLPSNVTGTSTFLWDGGGSLGGIDLTDGGMNDRIDINILGADLAGVTYTLSLDGEAVSLVATTGGTLSFNFAAFGTENGSNVDAISLLISGPESFDTSFDFIGAVPSTASVPIPAAGLLSLVGLGAFGALRARRTS